MLARSPPAPTDVYAPPSSSDPLLGRSPAPSSSLCIAWSSAGMRSKAFVQVLSAPKAPLPFLACGGCGYPTQFRFCFPHYTAALHPVLLLYENLGWESHPESPRQIPGSLAPCRSCCFVCGFAMQRRLWPTMVTTEPSSGFTGPSAALSAGPLGRATIPWHLCSSDGPSPEGDGPGQGFPGCDPGLWAPRQAQTW